MNHNATSLLRIIILLLSVLSTSALTARSDKEFKKLIQALDVPDTVKRLNSNDPALFWNTLAEQDIPLNVFLNQQKNNHGTIEKAYHELRRKTTFYPQYDPTVSEDYTSLCQQLSQLTGINDGTLYVIDTPDANAFATPTEEDYAILLYAGIFNMKGLTTPILMGYIAHEQAHCILQHIPRQITEYLRKKSKNKVLSVLAQAVVITSGAVSSYYNGQAGIDNTQNIENMERSINNIQKSELVNNVKYRFRYSRDIEFQADLVAYRFMEYMGYGDTYIESLRCLAGNTDKNSANFEEYELSDHPSFQERIAFLKYVREHPELGYKGPTSIRNYKYTVKNSDPIYD